MGAWGHGAFDNDTACDWLMDLLEVPTQDRTAFILEDLLNGPDEVVVAAAEVVASAIKMNEECKSIKDKLSQVYSEGFEPTVHLRATASQAIKELRKNSNLLGLWDDAGKASDWLASLNSIQQRLET